MTEAKTPARSPQRRGRHINAWLSADEWLEFERVRCQLGTKSMRATITRVMREALGALALELFDRRAEQRPIDVDRRQQAGRRAYDGAAPGRGVRPRGRSR